MSSQYRNLPDKLLRVRTRDGSQHFWPVETLRGIRRGSGNGNYVEICFDSMLRNGDPTIDTVRIKFRDVQLGAWGSIIKMYEEIITGKAVIFTIADVYADPPFYNLQAGKVQRDTTTQAGSWDLGPNGDGSSYYGETISPSINETDLDLTVRVTYAHQPAVVSVDYSSDYPVP